MWFSEGAYEVGALGKPVGIGIENAVEFTDYNNEGVWSDVDSMPKAGFEDAFERFLRFYAVLVPLARLDCAESDFVKHLNRKTDICERLGICQ